MSDHHRDLAGSGWCSWFEPVSIKGEHPARTGNHKLKRAFFLAAFAALHDPTSRTYYDRKVRHEALDVRVEVRDLRRPAVAVAGLKLGAA